VPKPFQSPSPLIVALCSALLLIPHGDVQAQTATVPVRDPNAVALAARALQALAGGTALTDITLQGSVTYTADSHVDTGTAILVARGNMEGLVTLNLSGGQRQEIRHGAAGVWIDSGGTPHPVAPQNCNVDAAWFFPALSLAALKTDSTLIITLVGQQTYEGEQVYHLILFHNVWGQPPDVISQVQSVSKMDLYLDATSLLPSALDFSLQPDSDSNAAIPVEIRFSAYQSFGGVLAPTRIQKYLQGSLVLDITATSAVVNSGVADSLFALPAVQPVVPSASATPWGQDPNDEHSGL